MIGLPVEFTMPSGFNRGSTPNDTPYCGIVNAELFGAAIPQPSGETSSKRPGSLEMPAFGGGRGDSRWAFLAWERQESRNWAHHGYRLMPEGGLEIERPSSTKGETGRIMVTGRMG